MTATMEPCATCNGLGHVCDEEPDHIHQHVVVVDDETTVPDPDLALCPGCGGRGLTAIPKVDDLEGATKAELVERAEGAGVDTSGTKADIVDRLVDAGAVVDSEKE